MFKKVFGISLKKESKLIVKERGRLEEKKVFIFKNIIGRMV